jgi:hypothetical protein
MTKSQMCNLARTGVFVSVIILSICHQGLSLQSTAAQNIRPINVKDTNGIGLRNWHGTSFVAFSIQFVEAVLKHREWEESDQIQLSKSSTQLRQIFDSMPIGELPRYGTYAYKRRERLMREHGNIEGSETYWKEWRELQTRSGKIVTLKAQQEAVWKIFKGLEGKISEFEEFEKAFILAIASRTGPVEFFSDAGLVQILGTTNKQDKGFRQAAIVAGQKYDTEIAKAKKEEFAKIWNCLQKSQQEKFLRLLGNTERVLFEIYNDITVAGLIDEWRGRAIDDVFYLFDGSDLLIHSTTFKALQNRFYSQNFKPTNAQINQLRKHTDEAIAAKRMRFANKTHHQSWFKHRKQTLAPLISYLDRNKSNEAAKKLASSLEKLIDEMEVYRHGKSTELVELRSREPMIYYLTELQRLDDSYSPPKHPPYKSGRMGNLSMDNYLPFIAKNPYPKAIYPKRPIDKNDAFHQQALKLGSLQRRWNAERQNTRGHSNLVALNNRYLTETKKLMLPSQYGETFNLFFRKVRFLAMFYYHDVAKDFGISEIQRNRMREIAGQSADRIEAIDKKLRRTALSNLLSSLPETTKKSLNTKLDMTEKELTDFWLLSRNEIRLRYELRGDAGVPFSSTRQYKSPYGPVVFSRN